MTIKKNFCLVVLLAVSTCCIAAGVDIATARKVGTNFFSVQRHSDINFDKSKLTINSEEVRYLEDAAVCYIFGFNTGGFIIVAADDASIPVIGYSAVGLPPSGELPPAFSSWMNRVDEQILSARANKIDGDSYRKYLWALYSENSAQPSGKTAEKDVLPLCSSTWAQGKYYNLFCPLAAGGPDGHAVVGCVATAMSQIMYYWRYPGVGAGLHNGINFGGTHYRWGEMLDEINSYNYGVAELCYHTGMSVGMMYSATGSAAFSFAVPYAMRTYFRYADSIDYAARSGYSDSSWTALLRLNLDSLRPLLYSASDPLSGGHAWVCDGYQGADYFHMNWGWGGNSNGYFYVNNLVAGGYSFTQSQAVVHSIYPKSPYPYYCQADTVHLPYTQGSFSDGSACSDYQHNMKCNWLIDPQEPVNNIFLSFKHFNTESDHDSVIVYDGADTTAPVLGSFSGNVLPPDITSSGNRLFVCFRSDSANADAGWAAQFHCSYPANCSGITTLSAASGSIDDGSGSENYPYNQMCRWRIRPANAAAIELSFSDFDIAQDDYLKITDEESGSDVATLSGNSIPDAAVFYTGKLLLLFKTNSIFNADGFTAHYKTFYAGLDQDENDRNFFITPNPATDFVKLNLDIRVSGIASVAIFSSSGRLVYSSSSNVNPGEPISIGVSELPAGLYMLRIAIENESICRKLIIGSK